MSAVLAPRIEQPVAAMAAAESQTLADRVKPLLADFAKKAAATEAARMVSAESIDALRKVGLFRSLVPKDCGGDERSLIDFCKTIRLLASACPSTAWVAGVLSVHPAGIAHYDKRTQDEFWATGPDTICSSSGSPIIKATLEEGGVRITGRGRWSSGCDHASWAMVGIKVPDVSNKRFAEVRYSDYMALIPRSDYTIDDTWYSTGMRGSGSKDLVFDNLFIPHRRMERMEALMFGYAHGEGVHKDCWLTRAPFNALFGIFLPAVALGCADGMIDQFVKRQRVRKNNYTGAKGILSVPGYMRLAESTHELESLGLYYDHLLSQMMAQAYNPKRLTEALFLELQVKFPFVTRRAIKVIDRLFEASGASAIADFNPMQRFWRDGHTAALHLGSDYDISLQQHGRHMLDLMMDPNL